MIFLKNRTITRRLLAFEVMYLLRQFPRVPAPMLENLRSQICRVAQPYAVHFMPLQQGATCQASARLQQLHKSPEMGMFVEHTSALVMQCVVLFYLGDVDQAMTIVPHLSCFCGYLPAWCTYLAVHGLYWCGRLFTLNGDHAEALRCMRQAKSYKKYPFNT